MTDAAGRVFLENLKQLLVNDFDTLGNDKEQFVELYKDLLLLKEKRGRDLDEIRLVFDKAEAVIDKFLVTKAKFKGRNGFRKSFRASEHEVFMRNIEKEIGSVSKMVKDMMVKEIDQRKMLPPEDPEDPEWVAHKTPLALDANNVVGFDKEVKTVIKRLTREDEELDIITIIGMAGLGKTELARKIYNDPKIEGEFFTRAWVYISASYSRREIFLSILSQCARLEDTSDMSDDKIAEQLVDNLKGKYLIVMDNLQCKEAWNDLKYVFPNNKKGSRILITSQYNEVAFHANPTKGPHKLKCLSTQKSWELLENKVFGIEKCPKAYNFEELGVSIGNKCEGLPLDIVVIAGILMNYGKSISWWNKVATDVNSFPTPQKSMKIIALSYEILPYHLKSCFLYLGVLPRDNEIPVCKLIRLWIAEGLIEQHRILSMEYLAETYIRELVSRNLLMVTQRKFNEQIKSIRVHSMIYDFCKTNGQKQDFHRDINSSDITIPVHSGAKDYVSWKLSTKRLRSSLLWALERIAIKREHKSKLFKPSKSLRVLDIYKSVVFHIFPEDLLQLVLLRYISISCNISVLPPGISKLSNMESLTLLSTSSTLELQEDMWNLYHLRFLHTNASALLPNPQSHSAKGRKNMQSLSMISPESCTEEVFARTPNITKLGVRGKLQILFQDLFENLRKLRYLTNLKLSNDVSSLSTSSASQLLSLPPYDKFPIKIKKLTLSDTLLEWEQMEILGELINLEVLKLKDDAFKGRRWEPKQGGFPALKLLHIGRTELVTWNASKHHFPSLTRLVLRYCDSLETVPSGLEDLESFKELALYATNTKVVELSKEIQQKKMAKLGQDIKANGGFKLFIWPPEI